MMKKVLELLVCLLHPVAVILIWIDLATRRNIGGGAKVAWALFALIPLVPFLYVLTGGDLIASFDGTSIGGVRATTSKSSGNIYFEAIPTARWKRPTPRRRP